MQVKHPSELRADFWRFYRLNVGGMGTDYSYAFAADLAANLPPDSATMRALDVWTEQDWMLWRIEYHLRVLCWHNTKDGKEGRNRPKPLPTPQDRERVRGKIARTDMQRIARALGIDTEGGVENG